METSSIEAPPLEALREEQAERLLEFTTRVESTLPSGTALAILMWIAADTLLGGQCAIPHRAFQRRCGVCRRTVDAAIKTLKRRELIVRVGATPGGWSIYRANLDERQTDALV